MKEKENIDLVLLNIARKEHNADWNWKNVNSPFARIYMVESGSARVVMPDGVHTIRPGRLYLVPSFTTHSYENPDFFVLYYLHIYDKNNLLDLLDFPFEIEATEMDFPLIKRLLLINPGRELSTSNPQVYDTYTNLMKSISDVKKLSVEYLLETRGILLQLFSRFMAKASVKQTFTDDRIRTAVNYIRTHIDSSISINELSGLLHLNNDYFIRLFKREMQLSPLQYINWKKIEKAQLLLAIGNESVKNIAYSLSFNDISHFFKLFKKLTGVTPNHFRILQKNN
jgi:AraC-like DNA-binding protein